MEYVIGTIILLLHGLLWGFLADKIVHSKGYDENWFWWGFFFGLATVVFASLKPAVKPSSANCPIRSNGTPVSDDRCGQFG